MRTKNRLRTLATTALLCAGGALTATAQAATITVNSTADTTGTGVCTLRDAITAANTNTMTGGCVAGSALPTADTIAFNIDTLADPGCNPVLGTCVIAVASALPAITEWVHIDGYTQPGASPNTNAGTAYPNAQALNTQIRIEVDGSTASGPINNPNPVDGFVFSGGNANYSSLRGLSIVNFFSFNNSAVATTAGANSIQIAGNFIGIHADGSTVAGNGNGVSLGSQMNTVGQTGSNLPADRNLIAGNQNTDVSVNASSNTVAGNLVCTDALGTTAKSPNTGIFAGHAIGTAVDNNLVAGCTNYGMLFSAVQSTTVQGNTVGIAVGGGALGNGIAGITVVAGNLMATHTNLISGNGIANNGSDGLSVQENGSGYPTGTRLDSNAIWSNAGLGINLRPLAEPTATVTPNDNGVLDADAGPNGLQNFPVITSASVNGNGDVVIGFTLDTLANTSYDVSAYSNPSCHPSGHGDGRYPASASTDAVVTTNGSGQASGTITVPAPLPAGWGVGQVVTLLAHDQSGANTSEFSACMTVSGPVTYSITAGVNPGAGGSVTCNPNPVSAGSTSSCTVTTNAGYQLTGVTSDCGGSLAGNTYTTGAMTGACSVTANFAATYPITATANPVAGGSVSCNPNPVVNGGTSSCTVTTNAGYQLSGVTGSCGGVLAGATYTTNAVTGACSVTANFTAAYPITATANPVGGGSVSCNPNPVVSGGASSCTVTTNAGYQLTGVTGSCGGVLAGATYTTNAVTGACSVTANYTVLPGNYTISATANPPAAGSVSCSPNPVPGGATSNCTVTTNNGYQLSGVSGSCGGTLSGGSYTTNAVNANCTVTANFSAPVPVLGPLALWGLAAGLAGLGFGAARRRGRRS